MIRHIQYVPLLFCAFIFLSILMIMKSVVAVTLHTSICIGLKLSCTCQYIDRVAISFTRFVDEKFVR